MKKQSIAFAFIGLLFLGGISGCSKIDSQPNTSTHKESGKISSGDITLTYGSDQLQDIVSLKNTSISFQRLANADVNEDDIARKVKNDPTTAFAKLTLPAESIEITNSQSEVTLQSGKTYYIPKGESYQGKINFWHSDATLYIFGTWDGDGSPVNNDVTIKVATTGKISATHFKLNYDGSILENYGQVDFFENAFVGEIYNYHHLTFKSNTFYLYTNAKLVNHCRLTFDGHVMLQSAVLQNFGQVDFHDGFNLNSGVLNLYPGSLANVTGGKVKFQKTIKNPDNSGYARLNLKNATTIENSVWTQGKISGKIDVNIDAGIDYSVLTSDQGPQKMDEGATINQNIYIAGSECIDGQGTRPCDNSALNFTLVATVKSPTQQGDTVLSATDIDIDNGYAYVSYHTNDVWYGSTPYGALRVFNIQDYSAPNIVGEATFNHKEFNGIDADNGTLYAVGGNKDGALLLTAPLVNGTFTNDLSSFKTYDVLSSTAKNSFIYNNKLWLVSGATDGGFVKLDPNNHYELSQQVYADENGARAKYVAENGVYQVFFAVEPNGAYLRIANIDGTNPRDYHYSGLKQDIQDGKNVIAMDDDYVYVALSDAGVAKVRLTDGKLVSHFVPNTYKLSENGTPVFAEGGLTNGVAVSHCHLFLANGADGVIVLNKNTFEPIGSFQLSQSSNNVYAKDGLLFVATGRDGLNIIKIN